MSVHQLPHTYEAEGLIPVPPLNRGQARSLCGTVTGAEGYEDGCLLYCAVDIDGTIVAHGTYNHVQPHLGARLTLMAISSHDPGDPKAPLNGIWVPVRVHLPDITGPIPALANALETATYFPMLMWDRYALVAYRDALAAYNPTVHPSCRVELSLTMRTGQGERVSKDIATVTVEDLASSHKVSWPQGRTWEDRFVGPVYADQVLYLLPAPAHSRGWRWYDPCGVCSALGRRHPACHLCI